MTSFRVTYTVDLPQGEATVTARYYPPGRATQLDPAEGPELDVTDIVVDGKRVAYDSLDAATATLVEDAGFQAGADEDGPDGDDAW